MTADIADGNSAVTVHDDGSVTVNGKRYWRDYETARRNRTLEKGVRATRWIIGPNKYTTLYN